MKQLLSEKICILLSETNLPRKTVKDIISRYLAYRKLEILEGKEVLFKGIVSIVPTPSIDGASTIGMVAKTIAIDLGVAYNTVFSVINRFMDIQFEQLSMGRPVDFKGIVRIKPIVEDGVITTIHSVASSSLKEDISYTEGVESVRVYTSKSLRQNIIGNKVSGEIVEYEDDITEGVLV